MRANVWLASTRRGNCVRTAALGPAAAPARRSGRSDAETASAAAACEMDKVIGWSSRSASEDLQSVLHYHHYNYYYDALSNVCLALRLALLMLRCPELNVVTMLPLGD